MPALDDWHFSRHAVERALDMCVERDELIDCLLHPRLNYQAPAKYGENCRVYVKDRIALAVDDKARVVITVLWNGDFSRDNDLGNIRD